MANKNVNFYEGSKEAFDNLANKEANAFYNIDGELHFGEDKVIKEKDLEVYQTKEDADLDTEDKTIVGAINELYAREDKEGLNEEQVKEIISAETEKYQTKEDETLNTENKTIVGAINELAAREDKEGLNEEQVNTLIENATSEFQTAEQVQSIVDEKIGDIDFSTLQTKEDEALNTNDKTIVGAINELENTKLNRFLDASGLVRVYAQLASTDNNITPGKEGYLTIASTAAAWQPNRLVYLQSESAGDVNPTSGYLLSKDPTRPYQTANKRYVDEVKDRVSLLEQQNEMMSQVIQPIEDTYLSKSFTQKMSIFDNNGLGGKSKLLSIEGNTESCKNLLNPTALVAGNTALTPEIVDNGNVIKVTVGDVNHMVFFYSLGVLPAGNYTFSCGGVSTNKVHPNSPDEKYSVITYINNGPDRQYIMPQTSLYPAQYTFEANGINTVEVAFKRCTTDTDETITITRPQLERNNYKTDFVPYYEGYKSPIINGIQSKSIFKDSEQIINNYFNSEYECGAGVILDFENKKIIKKYVDITFDGSEDWFLSFFRDPSGAGGNAYSLRGLERYSNIASISSTLFSRFNSGATLFGKYQYDYTYFTGETAGVLVFSYDGVMTLEEWKNYLQNNPITIRFLTLNDEVVSEEPLDENDIITTFNQCTQKPIYFADQDIVSKIPLKIKQEVVLTNQRESTTPLKPLTPATTAANLVEDSGGDYGIHTYTFSGGGDFVYNEPIVLDYNEKLVAEFAINPTSSNYITGDSWLAITLGNTPPAGMDSYPQVRYNMVTYSSMRQVIWGATAVNGKTNFKTGFSEIYPNEFGNSNLDSYYYKVEVTRVGLNLYNYRLSRLRKGVENSYEIIDEIQDIKTDENSAGISSYYVQSIMIAGVGHQLKLSGLRFYKAQL